MWKFLLSKCDYIVLWRKKVEIQLIRFMIMLNEEGIKLKRKLLPLFYRNFIFCLRHCLIEFTKRMKNVWIVSSLRNKRLIFIWSNHIIMIHLSLFRFIIIYYENSVFFSASFLVFICSRKRWRMKKCTSRSNSEIWK